MPLPKLGERVCVLHLLFGVTLGGMKLPPVMALWPVPCRTGHPWWTGLPVKYWRPQPLQPNKLPITEARRGLTKQHQSGLKCREGGFFSAVNRWAKKWPASAQGWDERRSIGLCMERGMPLVAAPVSTSQGAFRHHAGLADFIVRSRMF